MLLEIENLHAQLEDGAAILKGVNLAIQAGEIHAIMGPNGAGKSTLAKILAGHPGYEVTEGRVFFLGKDLLAMEPDERARLGLFMSFQYPPEITGISTRQLLYQALNERSPISEEAFDQLLFEKMALINMRSEFALRNVNEGFSGGEKKRCEILQMALLAPQLAILDETDSGLDIDALRIVADGVNRLMDPQKGLLMITHYQRLLDYIKPHYVHVFVDGKLAASGDAQLAVQLEKKGYDHFRRA